MKTSPRTVSSTPLIIPSLIAFQAVFMGGCQKSKPQYYETPSENPPSKAADKTQPKLPPGHPDISGRQPLISWDIPETWVDNGPHPVRKGDFHIHGKDGLDASLIVIDFPSRPGTLEKFLIPLAKELKLDSIETPELMASSEKVKWGKNEYRLFQLRSEKNLVKEQFKRETLAAVYEAPRNTWLFKMTGPEPTVEKERKNFEKFLASVAIREPSAAPPTLPMSAQSLPPGTSSNASNPNWTAPDNWLPGKPSQMRRGSFAASGPEGQSVDISITAFPGDVGGDLRNINRWRRQLGLSPVSGEAMASLIEERVFNANPYRIVTLAAETASLEKKWPQSSLIAIFKHEGNSWFFKMTGDAPLVEREREHFFQFLDSVQF